jgi:hypothetical protein
LTIPFYHFFHTFGDIFMKRFLSLAITACVAVWMVSCAASTDTGNTNNQQNDATGGLVGTWVSAGQDVAPLLKIPLIASDSITANFNAQGGYSVTSYSARNGNISYTGSYTVAKSTKDTLGATIYTIDIRQATPGIARVQGIYVVQTSVSPARMLYEVVQVESPAGTPPTVASGFGTSKDVTGRVLAALGLSNVQVFRKR